jgi:hypothetical protein
MAVGVVTGASLVCTMGGPGGTLNATAQNAVRIGGMAAATIADAMPMTNIVPGSMMCTSMANPAVASATAAAWGVLTPQPCVPVPAGMWTCSGTPMICGMIGLNNTATLQCSYGGTISIVAPGQGTAAY